MLGFAYKLFCINLSVKINLSQDMELQSNLGIDSKNIKKNKFL